MTVRVEVVYEGDLHCVATHGPSGDTITTDAPVDNRGKGEHFSPTDLVGTAMGTCMLTIMGIRAQEHAYPLDGARLVVKKHMSHSGPRRIATLEVHVVVPEGGSIAPADRQILEHAAHHCPVRLSILEAIHVPVSFDWGRQD